MKVKGIARYAHVLKPSSKYNKYSINVLIHKEDPQCAEIEKIINETIANKHPSKTPKNFKTCWKDLSIESPENEELLNYMCLTASPISSSGQPHIVDHNITPIIDPNYQIEGQYVYIEGNPWIYDKESDGIMFILNGTMVLNEKGPIPIESISSKPTVDQMFSDVVKINPTDSPNDNSFLT